MKRACVYYLLVKPLESAPLSSDVKLHFLVGSALQLSTPSAESAWLFLSLVSLPTSEYLLWTLRC